MTRALSLLGAALLGLATPARSATEAPPVRRLALVVGANAGTADRARLRFALLDADRFARVMKRMGGVDEADCILLREPTRRALLDALAVLRGRLAEMRATAQRTEALFYFSGHADEAGLLLGREQVGYAELREILAGLPSDLRIAVLDACASGAITRLKGGRTHPAFLSDLSSQVRGQAFLTSSSESEAAQESDRLQGSFFTHALLSGLRGAADVSGDGKVTLGEAYQFAFQETMARTASTEGGTQHPTYDMKMAGTGDVVLTDLRETSAAIVLGPDFDGRFFIRDSAGHLVAELNKPAGRSIELGVEAGGYEVSFEQPGALLRARILVAEGQRRPLTRAELKATGRHPTRLRGAAPQDAWTQPGRSRLEIIGGGSDLAVRTTRTPTGTTERVSGGTGELSYAYWARPDVSLDVGVVGQDFDITTREVAGGDEVRVTGSYGAFAGARGYAPLPGPIRPFVLGGIGFLTDYTAADTPTSSEVSQADTDFAFRVGGGVEARIGQHASVALRLVLTRRDGNSDYGGAVGFGWTFGQGR